MKIQKKSVALALLASGICTSHAYAEGPFDGPYIGALLGYQDGALYDSDNFDISSPDETIQVSYAQGQEGFHGLYGEVLIGYGKTFNNTYLGAELFYGDSSAEAPDYRRVLLSSPFEIENEILNEAGETYGAAFRVGRYFSDNTLGYARLGYVNTEFEGPVVSGSDGLDGYLAGVGTEISLTDNLNFRADYSYRRYESIGVNSVVALTTEFDRNSRREVTPSSHVFGAGLVYNFGSAGEGTFGRATPEGFSFDGLYGAATIGSSEGDVSHNNWLYDAFGGGGFAQRIDNRDITIDGLSSELLLGYGQTVNGLYLGAEIVAQLNDVSKSERLDSWTSSGSTLTQESKYSLGSAYGLAARLGKPVSDNVLAYVRGGYMWSDIHYINQVDFHHPIAGHIETIEVDFTDDIGGVMIGGGMELAVTKNLSARFDYSFTDYDEAKYSSFVPDDFGGSQSRDVNLNMQSHRFGAGLVLRLN